MKFRSDLISGFPGVMYLGRVVGLDDSGGFINKLYLWRDVILAYRYDFHCKIFRLFHNLDGSTRYIGRWWQIRSIIMVMEMLMNNNGHWWLL